MPRADPIQNNFNGGEISPLLYGRPDVDRYKTGLQTCLNMVPLVQGPIERRPGTKHIIGVKTNSLSTLIKEFVFSSSQAYIIEFGNLYARFIKDRAQIDTGSPIELTTTYLTADLFSLRFAQSADLLYITHKSYPPRKMTRTSDTAWSITNVTFIDGPYLVTNSTTTTLVLSATSGSVTVTASAVTGINGGTGFQASDIGRLIRWKDAAGNWTYLTITARANTTSITATIDGPDASATTATINWRLGLYSGTTGYPSVVGFHQNRLGFAGTTDFPLRYDLSVSGDFENMAPTDTDGTVLDDSAVTDSLSGDTVDPIRWMMSDEKGLLLGTFEAEWVSRPSDTSTLLTPSNVKSARSTGYGSGAVEPKRAGKVILFVQKALRKIRELAFIFEDDGFRAPDLTLVAEHISRTGIVQMAYQREPQSVLWCVLGDGTLIALTYERDQKVVGWSRHVVGGVSDAGTTQAKVESVAVIPNPAGDADEVYLVVNRYINGGTVRYIEHIKPFWDETNDQEDAFYIDSGLSLDTPIVITGITAADPAVVTAASHSIADGAEIRMTDIVGMTEANKVPYRIGQSATNTFELFSNTKQTVQISGATSANPVVITAVAHGLSNTDEIMIRNVVGMTQLNGKGFTVANKTTNTFQLSGINGTGYSTYTSAGDIHHAIDTSDTDNFTAYVSDGKVRARVSTLSGLSHLEGQSVSILTEGAVHPNKTVASGAVTLNYSTSKAHVGLGFTSDFQTLRTEAGSATGTAQGKVNRFQQVIMRFHETLGGSVGPDADNLDDIVFRAGGDSMDAAVAFFSGDVEFDWDGEYSSDNHIFYRQTQPLPVTISAVMPQLHTQDG